MGGGGHQLTVSAVVLTKSNCRFTTASSSLSLAINPASTSAVSASASVSFRCTGSVLFPTWALLNNSGLHGTGPTGLRMRHTSAPSEFLPYTLSYPTSGSLIWGFLRTVTVTATVAAADYQNVLPGAYSDRVTLSLLP